MLKAPVGWASLEDSSYGRAKETERSERDSRWSLNYRFEEQKTTLFQSVPDGASGTMTQRTLVTPEIAWRRAITTLRLRGHEFEEAWELAWQDRKKAMSYVYFCMAKERLVKDYPRALWTLRHLKMLHRRIRSINKNVEPKRLPGLRWILTTKQTDAQHIGAAGLESPLTVEQIYSRMGGYSIPSGATLEDQIIRSLDLERALRGLTPTQRKFFLVRSEGWERDSICRTLSLTSKSYENLCRSLAADRSAGRRIRERLAVYGQGRQKGAGPQLRGHSELLDPRPFVSVRPIQVSGARRPSG